MKCDVCENEATVYLTQIINGQMTTVNLCDTCSKAKGVTDETGFGLAEAFLSPSTPAVEMESECRLSVRAGVEGNTGKHPALPNDVLSGAAAQMNKSNEGWSVRLNT